MTTTTTILVLLLLIMILLIIQQQHCHHHLQRQVTQDLISIHIRSFPRVRLNRDGNATASWQLLSLLKKTLRVLSK